MSFTLTNYSENEEFTRKIPTVESGEISLDFALHEVVILSISMNISHHDQVVSRTTKQDYRVNYNLTIDNADHSGLANIKLSQSTTGSDSRKVSANSSLITDAVVLAVCFISLALVIRSIYRAQKLRRNMLK